MEGDDLAAAVGPQGGAFGQKRPERRHVAGSRGVEEGAGDALALLGLDGVAGPRLLHMATGAVGQLAHRGGIAFQRRRHLVKADLEDVVQQEGGALQRRQPLHGGHQRQGQVVGEGFGLGLRVGDQGLGQPGADIGLAPGAGGFQLVQRQPRRGAGQPGGGFADLGRIDPAPAQPGLLHHVFRFSQGTEHAVGEARQSGAVRLEDVGGGVRPRHAPVPPDGPDGSRPPDGSTH
ncbi:hypothetical protein D3C80_995010 [compost metagenome]